jgi:CHAD domain-containing protein
MGTAHELLRPAIESLAVRARADAARVIASGATESADAEDALHDFRVDLRRLRTLLRAAGDLYDTDRVKAVGRGIKHLARATSTLRDEEVLASTLRAVDLDEPGREALERWLVERRAHERELRDEVVRLVGEPALDESLAGLGELIAGPLADEPAALFGRDRIEVAWRAVAAMLPVGAYESERLHELRILFKRLRYVAELVERQYPGGAEVAHAEVGIDTAALARNAARMQDALGKLHDADQALVLLDGAAQGIEPDARGALMVGLRARRGVLVESALAELGRHSWQEGPAGP